MLINKIYTSDQNAVNDLYDATLC